MRFGSPPSNLAPVHRGASWASRVGLAVLCAAINGLAVLPDAFAADRVAAAPAAGVEHRRPVLLHLPGISGSRAIDRMLVSGLGQGGVDADIEIVDWTGQIPGLSSLYARDRNASEAAKLSEAITKRFRADPARPIYLTCHSGGAGIVAWALERLPEDVRVESVLFLAPALSPGYDLSRALARVRDRAFVFFSPYDPVLGAGTRVFGTIDGVRGDAAGRVGFTRPDGSDAAAYAKLVAVPYDPAWSAVRNIGDHVGPMMRPFAKEILAPLLLTGQLPLLPTTRPATAAAATTRPIGESEKSF